MVTLNYRLTEGEYLDFNFYAGWTAPYRKPYRIRFMLRVIGFYTLLAAVILLAELNDFTITKLIIFAIPALVFFLLIPSMVKRGIRKRVRAILTKPENKSVLDWVEMQIADSGIFMKDSSAESKYNWDAIVRKSETPTAWYLHTNSYLAIVIPKRAVTKPEDRQELTRLFNQHLSLSTEFTDR